MSIPRRWLAWSCLASTLACGAASDTSGDGASADLERPSGLVVNEPGASPGYVLYSPLLSDRTYLIDAEGLVVHMWKSRYPPQNPVYLLENGNLLRPVKVKSTVFGAGAGGLIEEFSWDGELVWSFPFGTDEYVTHHDVEPLPNGNVLAIAWERKSPEEARSAGRRPDLVPEQGLWPDMVVEIRPIPPEGGEIVWEWHLWDHLVQNLDETLPNFGEPSDHPHRVDINGDTEPWTVDAEKLRQLVALGYVRSNTDAADMSSDLLHTNAIAYNPRLDQIAISVPDYNEIWILDHSTTTEEAAGSTGGRWGRGGDLLYRWGNASAHGHPDSPRRLFRQHDVRWIPEGRPGAGRLTIFNNYVPGRGKRNHSAVLEIEPPVDAQGRYLVPPEGPFGPSEPVWKYEDRDRFYSDITSGAERLQNGNTFITQGRDGRFFEVTPDGEIVWEYWIPYAGMVTAADGTPLPSAQGYTYAVFRAEKIPPDHPALAGREWKPLDPQPPTGPRVWPANETGERER